MADLPSARVTGLHPDAADTERGGVVERGGVRTPAPGPGPGPGPAAPPVKVSPAPARHKSPPPASPTRGYPQPPNPNPAPPPSPAAAPAAAATAATNAAADDSAAAAESSARCMSPPFLPRGYPHPSPNPNPPGVASVVGSVVSDSVKASPPLLSQLPRSHPTPAKCSSDADSSLLPAVSSSQTPCGAMPPLRPRRQSGTELLVFSGFFHFQFKRREGLKQLKISKISSSLASLYLVGIEIFF